ncbi:endonuclease NucS [Candidatus Bathyarchaeota archaeon]|nr:MAG: endonuclease NucS [Candidatus Bathyarchaeota archaeon]
MAKIEVLTQPQLEKAHEKLREAIEKRKTILLIGNCHVDYRGRASSKLEFGERITIVKEDGALLVHRPKGYEPVNWMPGGNTKFHTEIEKTENGNEILVLKAIRSRPAESVTVYFERVELLVISELVDSGKFSLYASEHDMQKAILMEPSILEEGFKPISFEKRVEPGFVDVYGIDSRGRLVVVEIKRRTAGKEAALQLAKYLDSIRQIVNREIRGILVAPRLAKGMQRLLDTLGIEFKALNPKKCAEILSKPKVKGLEEFL